jgi:hypothetical protein
MTDQEILDLGPAFANYLKPYFNFSNQERTAPHLEAYCRALLTDAPTKTVEPNALASGTAVRCKNFSPPRHGITRASTTNSKNASDVH